MAPVVPDTLKRGGEEEPDASTLGLGGARSGVGAGRTIPDILTELTVLAVLAVADRVLVVWRFRRTIIP